MFGDGKELRLFVVRDGETVVAIAPFYAVVFRLGPVRLRVLVPLGFGNDLTERLEMLVSAGKRAEVCDALGAYLARHRRGLWDVMIWGAVRADDLPPVLRRLAHEDDPRPFAECPLPRSWEEFGAGLNKSMRDNIKYYPRLLERHGHRATVRIAATADDIAPALAVFLRLHRMRALVPSMRPHDDRFAQSLHRRFLETVAPVLAAQGKVWVAVLTVDGADVAAQLVLEHAGRLYMYYSGFDPAWQTYSVGMITTATCIQEAIRRDVCQVDFLMGDGQFKQRWGARSVPVSRLILLRDSVAVRLCFTAYTCLQSLIVQRAAVQSRGGIGPRLRVLRGVFAVLGQPTVG